jgi:hypothetical protein
MIRVNGKMVSFSFDKILDATYQQMLNEKAQRAQTKMPPQDIKRPSVPTSEDLRLVVKLMKMTTSNVDTEALLALRKANEKLKALGWDWEQILEAKITIVGDPFGEIEKPKRENEDEKDFYSPPRSAPPPPQRPSKPQPAPQWSPGLGPSAAQVRAAQMAAVQQAAVNQAIRRQTGQTPPPKRTAPQAPRPKIGSQKPNKANGWCYSCGVEIEAWKGAEFTPRDFNLSAPKMPAFLCDHCNNDPWTVIAPKRAKAQTPSLQDLDL